MNTPDHTRSDRLTIAEVHGAATRCVRMRDRAAAVAELRSITTNPHLLAHGVPDDDPLGDRAAIALLLIEAGATEEEIQRCRDDRRPGRESVRRGIPGLSSPTDHRG